LQEITGELTEMGYRLIAITTDRPSKIRESVDKHDLAFQVLSDSTMTASTAFGIAYYVSEETKEAYAGYGIDLIGSAGMDHGILPVPSVFLVDKDGMVHFQYVNPNHRVRLNADVMRSVAKAVMAEMSED